MLLFPIRLDWNLLSTASPAINAWMNPSNRFAIQVVHMVRSMYRRSTGIVACLMAEALDVQGIHIPMKVIIISCDYKCHCHNHRYDHHHCHGPCHYIITTSTSAAAPYLIEILSLVVLLWKLQNIPLLYYATVGGCY
jgi:hypothetical protein